MTLDQLHTVACYAESVFNERPLCVMDANDHNFIPVTPNSLMYGRSLRHFAHNLGDCDVNDPEFKVSSKSISVMSTKLRSTLASVRKTWVSEYLNFLARRDEARLKRSPHTKSIIKPCIDDWVLIKDASKDLRIGRVKDLIVSEDGQVRSVNLKTESNEGIYPLTNLRYLEFHKQGYVENATAVITNSNVPDRPKRKAAQLAKESIKNSFA